MRNIFDNLFSVSRQRAPYAASAALALSILMTCGSAQAGFKYTPSSPPMAQAPASYDMAPVTTGAMLPTAAANNRPGMVEGFADKVPLTVALRQILPKGVMFTVADTIDMSTLVSWHGGRQWQAVLDDMLNAGGMKATYNQNTVVVEKAGYAPAVAANNAVTLREPPVRDAYAPTTSSLVAPAPAAFGAQPSLQQPVMIAPPAEAAPTPAGKLTARDLTAMELDRINRTSGAPAAAPMGSDNMGMPTAGMLVPPPGAIALGDDMSLQQPGFAPLDAPQTAAMPNSWEAKSGLTLHEVLADWAQRAGIELNWISEYDYPIQASMTINGSFEEAVRTLLSGFASASPQPIGRLHRNEQLGQLSLVIEMRGNLYNE